MKIFNASTGGSALWTEDHTISTTNGLFNLALGSNTTLDLAFDQAYFVSTIINGEELLPRIVMTASPYAFKAVSTEAPKLHSITISPGMINDEQLLMGLPVDLLVALDTQALISPRVLFRNLFFRSRFLLTTPTRLWL